MDLKATLSKSFIERIQENQRLAAGEPMNATMTAADAAAAVDASTTPGAGAEMVFRADSPAPLLGRDSSVTSVSTSMGGESVPLVRGRGRSGGVAVGAEGTEERSVLCVSFACVRRSVARVVNGSMGRPCLMHPPVSDHTLKQALPLPHTHTQPHGGGDDPAGRTPGAERRVGHHA